MGGALYYIPPEKKTSWLAEVEELGFTVEDLSARMTQADRRAFAFVGKLKNGKTERFVQLQAIDSGYVLAVRFAGRDDPEFLKRTLGSKYSLHRFEKNK